MKRLTPPPADVTQPDRREFQAFCQQLYDFFSLVGTATIDLGSITAGTVTTFDITVTGCRADMGQQVMIGAPSTLDADLVWCGVITADDTVTVRVFNPTGGAIDPASAAWFARVFQ